MGQRRFLGTAALLGAVAACSVINSYDDVVPQDEGDGGSAGSSSNGGSGGSNGGAPDGAGTTNGGEDSTGGVGGSPGGAGGVGGAGPEAPSTGLVVLGGTNLAGTQDLLLTLDPTSGEELSRETLSGAAVAGLAYDGAPGKDVWFVFTANDFPASDLSKADLQVRRYADDTNEWTTLKKVTALPPPRPASFVVLNDRLAYLSFGMVEGALTDTLTILDTTSPSSVKEVTVPLTVTGRVLGLVGTRGAPGDVSALGGTLALATGSNCAGAGAALNCAGLNLTPIFVGDSITTGTVKSLRGFLGRPAFASAATSQRAFVALPAASVNGNIDVIRFDPRDLAFEAPLSPPTPAKHLAALAVADCLDVTVFSSVAEQALWATSAQGTSAKALQTHEAQDAVYEPFTSSVIAPYNPDSPLFPGSGAGGAGGAGNEPEVAAFKVSKSGVIPSIKARTQATDWDPPSDVAINVAAARFPIPFTCPK